MKTLPGLGDNLTLQAPAFLHILPTPLADGLRILAEHAFAGAGHVAEDDIELQLRLSEIAGIAVGDGAALVPPLGDVLQQYLGSGGVRLVAYDGTPLRQCGYGCRRLAARSSAEVKDGERVRK